MGIIAETHEAFLRAALLLAEQAHSRGEQPFAALLVVRDEVVLTASNTVIADGDPTRHAELNLVSHASRSLPEDTLLTATLYSSTEPCAMCAGAIYHARFPRVVYACSGQGLCELTSGGTAVPCRQVLQRQRHSAEVLGPLLEEEGLSLHRRLNWWRAT